MYFLALATDYDGTIAADGRVDARTIAQLVRVKESGRKLVLVTGRELPDLKQVFPELHLFDRVVAENGALLYVPRTEEERVLAPSPSPAFIERLRADDVPISVGCGIVATWKPHEVAVLKAIRDLGLELQIIFNKGAVMILPAGVNKATGLDAALQELELSPHNVVGVGDAENDHAFLSACGLAAAVANAVPMLKEGADIVCASARGDGVGELIDRLLVEDGALAPVQRHGILLGRDPDGQDVYLRSHGAGVLIAGSSGIGKSTLATALVERMVEHRFQFCVFDPEGDYQQLENAVVIGDAKSAPQIQNVFDLLRDPANNVVINTLALAVDDRPAMFASILPELSRLRSATGRPHWLLIDEAHHMLPATSGSAALTLPREMPATLFITVHPDMMSPAALAGVGSVVALGEHAMEVLTTFSAAIDVAPPSGTSPADSNRVLFWDRQAGLDPQQVEVDGPRQAHRRHTRKYAQGDLGDVSFYFRGPGDRLNLRAQNLQLFVQIADGVDDETWEHHRRRGDYSTWFRTRIKDDGLADETAAIEQNAALDPKESRRQIAAAVSVRYTSPAGVE